MPAKIWYVDPTQSGGHSDPAWVGPNGTGHRVAAWSQVTKAADNWYFGLGDTTGPWTTYWDVAVAGLKIGSYGSGKHLLDFSGAAMQGSGTRCPFRVRDPDFSLNNVHVRGHYDQQTILAISDDGQVGLELIGNKLQGPGFRGAAFTGTHPQINIFPASTRGNWKILSNEIYDGNSGLSIQEDCLDYGLFASNHVHSLTGDDGGNSDGMTFGGSGGGQDRSSSLRMKIMNNKFRGFFDHALDFVGWNGVWVEGNDISNIGTPAAPDGHGNTAGLCLGGVPSTGDHFVYRNRVEMVLRPGMTYTNVPAAQTRGGNRILMVGNLLIGQGSGLRNTNANPNSGEISGIDNTAINCTLVSTGTGISDWPVYKQLGRRLNLINCALIGAAGAAIGQENDEITLRGCRTNRSSWRSAGSVGAFDIDGTNALSQTMPTGPDYFPTAPLLGTGLAHTRAWADMHGVKLPDALVGGVAPDARTTALPGVARKWFKGWARPGTVLA